MDTEEAKRHAARSAIESVEDGMVVGLGSGSTAAQAIRLLGERVTDGLEIEGVPTSYQAEDEARAAGIPVRTLLDVTEIHLTIDGADQVTPTYLIKGGGASHTREKIVANASQRVHIVVDETKLADRPTTPIPVEVVPFARAEVARQVRKLGGTPCIRSATRKSGPVITDNGNLVLDCSFDEIDPASLARELADIPGVLEHGLFLDLADELHIGSPSGARVETRR